MFYFVEISDSDSGKSGPPLFSFRMAAKLQKNRYPCQNEMLIDYGFPPDIAKAVYLSGLFFHLNLRYVYGDDD